MKKRIAKHLRRLAERLVNADFEHPDARRQMYTRYYRALKNEYMAMKPERRQQFLKENRA